jgi:hypothetical protein|tara:strand:+ start:505 stop:705 length:201 start_codon:yes stop_codon:yes gene_type:complete
MFKFLSGVATGWIAARSIPNVADSPLKPPTYDEIILLSQRAKEAIEFLSKKLEEADKESKDDNKPI